MNQKKTNKLLLLVLKKSKQLHLSKSSIILEKWKENQSEISCFLLSLFMLEQGRGKVIATMEERRAFCTVALVETERAGRGFLGCQHGKII